MVIGIDIDNTTPTTETIMHYARIFGEQRGLILPPTRVITTWKIPWAGIKRWRKIPSLPGLHLSDMLPKEQAVK